MDRRRRVARALARLVLCAIPAGVSAQGTTWIVDEALGAGAQFADIPPAVAAAANGDTILVRPGNYSGIAIAAKGLTVVGGPGVQVVRRASELFKLRVSDLLASQSVAIRGFDFQSLPSALIQRCAGPVLLEDVELRGLDWNVHVEDSARVTMSRCNITGRLGVKRSVVNLTDSTVVARSFVLVIVGGGVAVHAEASTINTSRCTITGENASGGRQAGAPALQLVGSNAVVTGDGSGALTAGTGGLMLAVSAIRGTGAVLLDPRVPLVPAGSAPGVETTLATTVDVVPSLATAAGPAGGTWPVDLAAPGGASYALFVSTPGMPFTVSTPGAQLWLAPPTLVVAAAGAMPASGRLSLSFGVPPAVAPGTWLTWQAAARVAAGWKASNPAESAVAQ